MSLDLEQAMAVARAAAEAASRAALVHFRSGVRVERKPDRSPVTAGDRAAEAAALEVIRAAFPDHAVLGEESGAHAGDAPWRWIIDPIDGTRGFTRGGTAWGPLVGLLEGEQAVAGAMALPALGESFWAARGLGCWQRTGDGPAVRLRVSGLSEWAEATFSMGEPKVLLAPPYAAPVEALVASCAVTRCVGDLAGCAQLLQGKVDAWLEAGVQLWDLAPLQILVEEAGGRFTDLDGTPTVARGRCLATNGLLHEELLRRLEAAR